MDTTSRLLMLLEVVEQGSFAKAAEIRNIDRSVISKQISRLEDELGVRLLNRTTRSFSLTAAGAEMI
jgi:DNA-binding transcriptional LysR family regulator